MEKLQPGQPVPDDIRLLFREHESYLAAGKLNYATADLKFQQILERCEPGVSVTLPADDLGPERTATIIDKCEEKNEVWVGAMFKRFAIALKNVAPQKRTRKLRED